MRLWLADGTCAAGSAHRRCNREQFKAFKNSREAAGASRFLVKRRAFYELAFELLMSSTHEFMWHHREVQRT